MPKKPPGVIKRTPLLLPDFLKLETSAQLTGTYLHVQRIPVPLVWWLESKYGDSLCHRNVGKGSPTDTGPSLGLTAVNPIPYRFVWLTASSWCEEQNRVPVRTQFLGVALGIFNYLLKRCMWPVYTAGSDQPPVGLWGHTASLFPLIQAPDIQEWGLLSPNQCPSLLRAH